MDNQHRKISGYRELNQAEIDAMNEIKAQGVVLGELVAKLRGNGELDQRWVSIGATDLQTGLMALTRAVARPTFFCPIGAGQPAPSFNAAGLAAGIAPASPCGMPRRERPDAPPEPPRALSPPHLILILPCPPTSISKPTASAS